MGDNRGSLLIEVMIGAVLVVLASVAVLDGFEGAFATSGKNKARSVAATLAEQDLERMRSFTSTELSSNFPQTQTKLVAAVPYTVESSATWITDTGDAVGCTASSVSAAYLRIRSSVSAAILKAPVVTESVLAPTAGEAGAGRGSAAVLVVNRAGNPVPGVTVTMGGPTPAVGVTNEEGCAAFTSLLAGSYNIGLAKTGMVTWLGTGAYPNKSVAAQETTLFQLDFDTAARVDVTFQTKIGAAAPTNVDYHSASFANEQIPLIPAHVTFPGTLPTPPAQPSMVNPLTTTTLYPFTGGYDVYAGRCGANNPFNYIPTYFTTPPGNAAHVQTDPGGDYDVTVRIPYLTIKVRHPSSGQDPYTSNSTRVWIKPVDAACGGPVELGTQNSTGRRDLPYPFGTYDVCVDRGGSNNQRNFFFGHQHTTPDGTSRTVFLNTSSGSDCGDLPWPTS